MALHARDKQRDREQRGDGADKPSRTRRDVAPLNEIEAIACENRESRAKQEGGVGRPAPEVDAGKMIEDGEDRRVAAQGVEGEKQRGGGEEADFLIRKEAPAQRREQRYERQFAHVDIGHVAREVKVALADRGPPEVFERAVRAEHIGRDQRPKGARRQRALECAVEIDLGSVRMRGELQREGERHGDDRQPDERARRERRNRAEFGRFIGSDAIGGISGKHQHA